jgi:hypothetical protein
MFLIELIMIGGIAYFIWSRVKPPGVLRLPDAPSTKPSYVYNMDGSYLAAYPDEKVFVVRGYKPAGLMGKAKFIGVVPFGGVRAWSNFRQPGFFITRSGIELQLSDPESPIVRLVMGRQLVDVWLPRISAILERAGHSVYR